jgi:hypothetical protein
MSSSVTTAPTYEVAEAVDRHLRMPPDAHACWRVEQRRHSAELHYRKYGRSQPKGRTLGGALKPNDFATASRSSRCTLKMLFSWWLLYARMYALSDAAG